MEEVQVHEEVQEVPDESPALPLPIRVLNSFVQIEETTFWPSDVTSVAEDLVGPKSFKEFNELLNSSNSNTFNNLEQTITKYSREYNSYLSELGKTPNVLSFDIDYI